MYETVTCVKTLSKIKDFLKHIIKLKLHYIYMQLVSAEKANFFRWRTKSSKSLNFWKRTIKRQKPHAKKNNSFQLNLDISFSHLILLIQIYFLTFQLRLFRSWRNTFWPLHRRLILHEIDFIPIPNRLKWPAGKKFFKSNTSFIITMFLLINVLMFVSLSVYAVTS